MSDILHGVWLASKYKAGHTLPKRLFEKFGSFEKVYKATRAEYEEKGFAVHEIAPLLGKSTEYAERICLFCAQYKTDIIALDNSVYPKGLYDLPDCPPVLFCKGSLEELNKSICVTLVGTRNMSRSGAMTAHRVAFEAANGGAVIVSGFARGIDSLVHRGALDAEGKTVAVLGCGIDVDYPVENTALKNEIISSGGAVITEFFPSTPPKADNFPVRNRVLSALSHCTVIAEAPMESGALITVNHASKQGKRVFAVPGTITSTSSDGNNFLIKGGIPAVLSGYDILEELDLLFPNIIDTSSISKKPYFIPQEVADMIDAETKGGMKTAPTVNRGQELSGISKEIYEVLLKGGDHAADEFINENFTLEQALYTLTRLEIDGYVFALPGGRYAVKNNE